MQQGNDELWLLPGAADSAQSIARCPLRYVLSDELVRTCVALAYSGGDELSGCLDLVRLPAEQLWIEWHETACRDELARLLPECPSEPGSEILRAGALIQADPACRTGNMHTFWLTRAEPCAPVLAAVVTLLDLEGATAGASPEALLDGQTVRLHDAHNEQVNGLLGCAGFRLDPHWQRYYRCVARNGEAGAEIVRRSLATVAFDVPMLLALFLLMSVRADLRHAPVTPARLNAKRARLGKRPLLEHIEVSAPLFARMARQPDGPGAPRRGPRLHHVRGHLVRRRNTVYWRGPHWRGYMRLGSVRTRTVELQLPRQGASIPAGTAPDDRGSGD